MIDKTSGCKSQVSETSRDAISDRRNAPEKPTSKSTRSLNPRNPRGQYSIILRMSDVSSASFPCCAVPMARRMPLRVSLTIKLWLDAGESLKQSLMSCGDRSETTSDGCVGESAGAVRNVERNGGWRSWEWGKVVFTAKEDEIGKVRLISANCCRGEIAPRMKFLVFSISSSRSREGTTRAGLELCMKGTPGKARARRVWKEMRVREIDECSTTTPLSVSRAINPVERRSRIGRDSFQNRQCWRRGGWRSILTSIKNLSGANDILDRWNDSFRLRMSYFGQYCPLWARSYLSLLGGRAGNWTRCINRLDWIVDTFVSCLKIGTSASGLCRTGISRSSAWSDQANDGGVGCAWKGGTADSQRRASCRLVHYFQWGREIRQSGRDCGTPLSRIRNAEVLAGSTLRFPILLLGRSSPSSMGDRLRRATSRGERDWGFLDQWHLQPRGWQASLHRTRGVWSWLCNHRLYTQLCWASEQTFWRGGLRVHDHHGEIGRAHGNQRISTPVLRNGTWDSAMRSISKASGVWIWRSVWRARIREAAAAIHKDPVQPPPIGNKPNFQEEKWGNWRRSRHFRRHGETLQESPKERKPE